MKKRFDCEVLNMTTEEYQLLVIDKLNDNITVTMVLCVIVASFMVYMVIHNMMNRR